MTTSAAAPLDPEALPLRPAAAVEAWGPTVVLAPHPDDESIGCGGAIRLLRDAGLPVRVVFASDGAGSHPSSRRYPAEALRALREREALEALAILGVVKDDARFLGLPDRFVPGHDDPRFADAVTALVAALASPWTPETVLVPWRRDPHGDHRATWQIATAAVDRLPARPRIVEYPVWVWDIGSPGNHPTSGEVEAWRLDITAVIPAKRAAIYAHRSQTTALIDDDPDGFRLPETMLERATRPWEVYCEGVRSLPPSYFERMYAADPDPWGFETRPYEAAKYAATVAALPRERYRAGFEVGCSVGVLTSLLAERCDALLAVDVSERALARARERNAGRPAIRFARMQVPDDLPDERFDLIVVSEVGYYWSWEDLAEARRGLVARLDSGGHLLLVHWTPFVEDYPLTGDEVHNHFLGHAAPSLRHLAGRRDDLYRLDLFERTVEG